MRAVALITITIFLLLFHVPAWAYHKWYDEKGIVHFSQADPPANAKNEDGTNWWGDEQDQEEEKAARKQRIQQARLKIKNNNAPKPEPEGKPVQDIDEAIAPQPEEEEPEQEPESSESKGFFQRITDIFSKDERDDSACQEPWLLEKHGICAFNKPDMEKIGNTFKAEVIDNRKCVWSDCRGTYNGDVVTFIYKGEGYWETNGNVPECPFYQGFHWQ